MIYNVINEKDGQLKSVFTFKNIKEAESCKKWHQEKGYISWVRSQKYFNRWID